MNQAPTYEPCFLLHFNVFLLIIQGGFDKSSPYNQYRLDESSPYSINSFTSVLVAGCP
jgi:hypothetical protein